MDAKLLSDAKTAIMRADTAAAERIARTAIEDGADPAALLENGFIPGILEMGRRFEDEEIFLPELMMAAETMKAAVTLCNAAIPAGTGPKRGRIVLGTVQGDIHDIGKNIVASFLEASGFEVHDLGRDVTTARFVEQALQVEADVIATSALLTTTMGAQRNLETHLQRAGLKGRFKTIVGGAPVDQAWADRIGADAFAEDAAGAAQAVRALIASPRAARDPRIGKDPT